MEARYFKDMLASLANRAASGTISWLGFANVPLRQHLRDVFSRNYGDSGNFIGDPAFEAVFGWTAGEPTMGMLAGDLLNPSFVDAMNSPPKGVPTEYRFPKVRRPYAHQLESWRILAQEQARSIVVASGAGSGKTECFMVPILDRLVREHQQLGGQLIGVRALFLYPLNALINSQRDRLSAWTGAFGRNVRFCLYNGLTPDVVKSGESSEHPSEVLDRRTLRATPAPILVTNATMLEYMLVRTLDAPIIGKSHGKLEWVVLDEAHTYIGSQAAEMALLIRRVLHAFGVEPERVRFIATSATIGNPTGPDAERLKTFLSQLAGIDASRVHVVAGTRAIPGLPAASRAPSVLSREDLWRLDSGLQGVTPDRYRALAAHDKARKIRDLFVGRGATPIVRLSEVCAELFGLQPSHTTLQQEEALDWLDLLASARSEGNVPFLPLRGHVFHQTLSGLWACADIACPDKRGSALADSQWPFGQIYLAPRQHCTCGAPVYEIVACEDCGTVYLRADEQGGKVVQELSAAAVDEFELETEVAEGEDESDEAENEGRRGTRHGMLIVNGSLARTGDLHLDREDRRIVEASTPGALRVQACEEHDEGLQCPACKGVSQRERRFRKARVGAPFLLGGLLPTLLEFAPDGDRPADLPYRGRRLLTFSDSRQGTARLAAKLQQDAERTQVRGLIYHYTLKKVHGRPDATSTKVEREISELETVLKDTLPESAKAPLERMLKSKKEEVYALSKPQPLPFREMQAAIAQEGQDFHHILRTYQSYSSEAFGGHDGAHKLSGMLLVREFGRRPRRQNNLETMGLIALCYPKLNQITSAPPDWVAKSFSTDDWKDLLKTALDHTVRGGGSLDVPEEWRNWLGMRFSRTWVLPATQESVGPRQRRWPSARRSGLRSTLARVLAYLLQVDIETAYAQDLVDSVLTAAWNDLQRAGVLSITASGHILTLEDIAFLPIRQAWVCPVTRRFLDTAVRGVTPYLPKQATEATAACERVDLPVYDIAFGGETEPPARIRRARNWLSKQALLPKLRDEGLWSDFNDRVVELAPYFATAEHSAQQPAALLARYENAFKEGRLNLLSCSTTMELGIDIGGVQIVAMNNVPPHPANYLQRAGRAGRRQETRSAAVTLCKSNPHDQTVFSNSKWPFETKLPAPAISLGSPVIVQRHVNAMVLSHFLADFLSASPQDMSKLSCGWFFDAGETGPSRRFVDWCSAYRAHAHERLERGLVRLVRHSVFEGIDGDGLARRTGEELATVAESWMAEWNALVAQDGPGAAGDKNDPAAKAIGYQKRRLADEYLLRELATRGFLPAYGFPAFIAAFDNMTVTEARRLRPGGDGEPGRARQDDNRYRRRDLANRDLVTALREYAPGSEVVMDGLVYRSAGITLNWHVPADQQDARETQAIRFSWRCRRCGASGSSLSLSAASTCDACGSSVQASDVQQFLQPAGFSVDFYHEPHNDVSTQRFVPVERPWISARGAWSPLPNPTLGRFRASSEGRVYHHSSGANGNGYAICLACGRAEPMLFGGALPTIFADKTAHNRLRSRKDDRLCPGSTNRWAIKERIALGHQIRTDVLEIQLKDESGNWLTDRTVALTITVALRDALAALIGIQANELACDVKEALVESGQRCRSMLVFDRFAAGYASGADRLIEQMLRRARERLECPKGCDSACPSCVLDFDQRFEADSLNRHAALKVLTSSWLNALKLPPELQFLGDTSRVETGSLSECVVRESGRPDTAVTRLFAASSSDGCSVGASPLRKLAYRLAALSRRVEIVVAMNAIQEMDEGNRYSLASLSDHPLISVLGVADPPRVEGAAVLAEVQAGSTTTRWATADLKASWFSEGWGETSAPVIAATGLPAALLDIEKLDAKTIRPKPADAGDREIIVHHQLDGNLKGFAARFWKAIMAEHSATKQLLEFAAAQVHYVQYSDRYLFTPLSVALLVEIVSGLREAVGRERWDNPVCRVITTRLRAAGEHRVFGTVYSDWPDSNVRDGVLLGAFEYLGIRASLQVPDRPVVKHGRALDIGLSNGAQITVRLDQGVSYWRVPSIQNRRRIEMSFHFGNNTPVSIEEQVKQVIELSVPIEGGLHQTEIFVKLRRGKSGATEHPSGE